MKPTALVVATTMLCSPALLRAQALSEQSKRQVAAIDGQIAQVNDGIARVKEVPVEFSGALILMGTGGSIRNPTKEQALQLVSDRKAKLAVQLAEAEKERASIEAEKKNTPVEFMALAEATAYVAAEKADLVRSEIADAQEDIDGLGAGAPGGQGLIDRKLALLDRTAAFLSDQKKLILGQDPRPVSR